MNPIATPFSKAFRRVSNGSFPRRLGDGVSVPPWPGRMAALALVVCLCGCRGFQELFHSMWGVQSSVVRFPALVFSLPMLGFAFYLARRADTTVGKLFGLTGTRLGQVLVSAVVLFVLEWVLMTATAIAVSPLGRQGQPESGSGGSVFLFFDMALWAPICEELSFRGLLYTSLRTRLGIGPSIVLTAAAFALAHVPCPVDQVAVLFVDALLSSLWYERTRSLWPNILSHSLNNVLTF